MDCSLFSVFFSSLPIGLPRPPSPSLSNPELLPFPSESKGRSLGSVHPIEARDTTRSATRREARAATCCDVLRTTCVHVRSCGESREDTAPPVRVERTWTSQRVERSAWCDVGALEGQRKKIGCGYEARVAAVAAACVARNRRRCRETTASNRLVGVSRGTSARAEPELASSLSRR